MSFVATFAEIVFVLFQQDCYRTMKKRGELGDLAVEEKPKKLAEKEDTGGQEEEKCTDGEEENEDEEEEDKEGSNEE